MDGRTSGKIGYKERVDFGCQIGEYLYKGNSEEIKVIPTTIGIIHYNVEGEVHVIPAKPNGLDNEQLFIAKDEFQKLIRITRFVLSTEHFSSLRGLAIDCKENNIILYFFNDGKVTTELENDYYCVGSEVIAHYENTFIEERIFRRDYPSHLPNFRHWAYQRKESVSNLRVELPS